ncbi:MAG: hypothetical protein AVDCRST_MAG49-194, partial [uncultured Thermomicrobiales bacterium]
GRDCRTAERAGDGSSRSADATRARSGPGDHDRRGGGREERPM